MGASFFCLGKEGHDAGKRVGTGLCSPFHPALADFLGSLLTGLIPVNVQHLLMGTLTDEEKTVLTVIRLPRFCYGALIGSALAASGAALQGVFGNPLADPGLLGISSGASLGAVLVLILNLAVLSPLMVPLGAFMGAALISFLLPSWGAAPLRLPSRIFFWAAWQ